MIGKNIIDRMFTAAGISQDELHAALCDMGPPPKKGVDLWQPERPSIGYCYVVSEVVSYQLKRRGVPHKTYRLDCGNGDSHWFIRLGKDALGEIIDLTADQIDGTFDYEKGKSRGFQINRHMKYGMSKAAEKLAVKLNIL